VNERSWLIPSVGLTFVLGASALVLMPNYSGVLPALLIMPLWLIVSAILAFVLGFARMAHARVPSPVAHVVRSVREDWRQLLALSAGVTMAGLNMVAFMWAKPLLNRYVPFSADPWLAELDRLLFLGQDPWRLLGWLNSMPMAIFYHRGWFALMIMTLLMVLSKPPSRQKSAMMLTYFLLWSVAGPLIHVLLPAAGPVFYERLGYGDRFAAIPLPHEMAVMSDYLWYVYVGAQFGPGSGISAMPSLHIATTVWMVMAFAIFARRWTWIVAVPGVLIFLLSISLGWHYAVDGIVGGLAALGCYGLCLRLLEPARHQLAPVPHSTGIQQA
jgi:hypothetical protein